MTFKEKHDQTTNWIKKIILINLFHKIMVAKHNNWTIRKTAKYFGLSNGLICENLKLAEKIELVRDCKNRKEALIKIKL